jgi:hypothetical protein
MIKKIGGRIYFAWRIGRAIIGSIVFITGMLFAGFGLLMMDECDITLTLQEFFREPDW